MSDTAARSVRAFINREGLRHGLRCGEDESEVTAVYEYDGLACIGGPLVLFTAEDIESRGNNLPSTMGMEILNHALRVLDHRARTVGLARDRVEAIAQELSDLGQETEVQEAEVPAEVTPSVPQEDEFLDTRNSSEDGTDGGIFNEDHEAPAPKKRGKKKGGSSDGI